MNYQKLMGAAVAAMACAGLLIAGPASAARYRGKTWLHEDHGVGVGAVFQAYKGGPTLKLPTSRPALMRYIKLMHARWLVAGPEAGARVDEVPKNNDNLDARYALAIEFFFPGQGPGETEPGYTAFLNDKGEVIYIEPSFGYVAS